MKRFGIVIIIFLAIFAVKAQTNLPPAALTDTNANDRWMSLQDCIQEALVHNLDIQIERYTPQADLYDLRAVYGGSEGNPSYDPTFNISGLHNYNTTSSTFVGTNLEPAYVQNSDTFNSSLGGTLPWGMQYDFIGEIEQEHQIKAAGTSENTPGDVEVTVSQPLLNGFWIDKTRLDVRLAKNTLESDEQTLRLHIINDVTSVATAYYELIYAFENVQVQQEALNLSQTQLDQDQQRVDIGSLAPLSVQQDQSQVAQNQANLISAQETLSSDQNSLKALLADTNYVTWHGQNIQPTEPLQANLEEFDVQDSWNKGMSQRPDLIVARLAAESQGVQLKFDRNQLYPSLDLNGSYGYNGSGAQYSDSLGEINHGSAPFYSYGASLSMPLGNVAPRNKLKADKVTLQQLLLTLKQDEQNILVAIDNAVQTSKSDYQSVDATKQARIYAEAALDAEQKTYAVGKATTFEVLTYQNNLTAARLAEIRALANYEEALATLSQQEGSTMDRYGIFIGTP